jgi:hypothetical protein
MLVLRNQLRLPPPAVVDYDPTAEYCVVACDPDKQLPAWADGRFETKEEYQRRMQEDVVQVTDGMVPRYTTAGASGQLVRSGQLVSPDEIYRTDVARPLYSEWLATQNLVSVVSMNLRQNTPGITDSVSMMIHDVPIIYASSDHLVLASPVREAIQTITHLFQIGWDRLTGQLQIAGIGRVAGNLSNQFSLDERGGYLRLATTATNPVAKQPETNLIVLENDHGLLEPVSGVHNLAPGNDVRFSRFDGDRALISTRINGRNRSVNTLLTVDLSDPQQPQLLGSAEISGDFSYLEIVGPQHLLAVGRNALPSGSGGPLHVTLFNIADLERPRISDAFTFERYSGSTALSTHLANGFFAQHSVLAIPFSQTILSPFDADGDGFQETHVRILKHGLSVLRIDPEAGVLDDRGIDLRAEVELPSWPSRVGFIDDVLFAFGNAFVASAAVENGELLNVFDVQATARNRNVTQIPQSHSGLTNSTFRLLRELAAATNVPVDGFTVETLADHAGISYAVVSNFDKRYLFVQSEETWRLADSTFEYPSPAMWHNDQDAFDVNRDGSVDLGDLAAASIAWTETRGIDYRVAHRIPIRPAESDQALDVNGDLQFSEFDLRWMASRMVQQAFIDLQLSNSIDELAAQVLSHAGDANGDGVFNSRDLVTIFQSAEYEDAVAGNSTWSEGDWNGDGDFTTTDLVLAFQFGRYSSE